MPVTSLADSGPGTLRDAIANATPGDTITFATNGTLTLTSGELVITTNLTISGPGAESLRISGNASNRVLRVAGGNIHLTGLTIADGEAGFAQVSTSKGGGLMNRGTTTVRYCVFSNNTAIPPQGGAAHAGAIYNLGTLNLTGCLLTNNRVLSQLTLASGGAILNDTNGTANLCSTVISSSILSGSGSPSNPTFGAGLANRGLMSLHNCTVFGNRTGTGTGGGIGNYGTLFVCGSLLYKNHASAGPGGGGIRNMPGGLVTLTNCTISSNESDDPRGMGHGGGILNPDGGTLFIYSSMVVSNHIGSPGSSGIGRWGGIENFGTMRVGNTMIAGNLAWRGTPDVSSNLYSEGFNFIQDTNGCEITGATTNNLYGFDPLLGPLQDNGGPTWTHALRPGSPALDAGHSGGLATDQRGGARAVLSTPNTPPGDGSDIGAFEAGGYVRLTSLTRSNTTAHLQLSKDLTTGPGPAHYLQRRAAFGPGAWEELPGGVSGTNALLPFVDAGATNAQNFYRVRVGP